MSQEQLNLFGNFESVTSELIPVKVEVTGDDNKEIKKLKKLFNSRMSAIRNLQESFKKLEVTFRHLNELYLKEVRSAEDTVAGTRLEAMEALDAIFDRKSLSQSDKTYIRNLIIEHFNILKSEGYESDLSKYDKYIAMAENEIMDDDLSANLLQSMLRDMMGVEDLDLMDIVGDSKLNPEEFAKKYRNLEDDETEDRGAHQQAKATKGKGDGPEFYVHFTKIYKQLAKRIHPDLEKDENVRLKKEALMKELADAKDKKDLFKLISIQGQVDQIEFGESKVDARYLKQYADRLLDQRKELQRDLYLLKNHSGTNSWLYQNFYTTTERGILNKFSEYRDDLEEEQEDLEDLIFAAKTVSGIREYIKENVGEDDFF